MSILTVIHALEKGKIVATSGDCFVFLTGFTTLRPASLISRPLPLAAPHVVCRPRVFITVTYSII